MIIMRSITTTLTPLLLLLLLLLFLSCIDLFDGVTRHYWTGAFI